MAMNHRLLRPRASGGGFDPRSISGLEAWWDFSDASTLYSDDAATTLTAVDGQIAVCVDKSGLGRNLSQTTANNRPLRRAASQAGRDAAEFDGSNDALDLPGSTVTFKFLHTGNHTLFFVFRPGASANPNTVHPLLNTSTLNASGASFWYDDRGVFSLSDSMRHIVYSGSSFAILNSFQNAVTPQAWSFCSFTGTVGAAAADRSIIRTGSGSFSGNTSTATASTADAPRDVEVGRLTQNNFFYRDRIGEIIIYSSALSAAAEQAVRLHLSAKWGL